jgi:hypothetical protein
MDHQHSTARRQPPPQPAGEYLTHRITVDPAVYRTDIPLVVAERCRDPGLAEDGSKLDFKTLILVWYGLRWLIAAFPERRGFGQRVIAEVAGVDQKYVHKYLRAHYRMGNVVEAGRERYRHLTGGDGRPKEQPVYRIPLDELDAESSARGALLLDQWRRRLYGSDLPAGPAPIEAQLALDLELDLDGTPGPPDPPEDQPDPLKDQPDPPEDQAPDPLKDQPDPPEDQRLIPQRISTDPPEDQGNRMRGTRMPARAVCPSVSQSEGAPFGQSAPPDPAQPDPHTPPVSPPPPDGERPLDQHPLAYLYRQRERANLGADAPTFALLAAEHDAPTAGHGWYWLGRAIDAALVGQGGIEHVRDLYRLTRGVLSSWRSRGAYGAPPAMSPRPPRPGPRPYPTPAVPSAGARVSARVSARPITEHPTLTGEERAVWLRRFRAACDAAEQRAVLARLLDAHPYPPAVDAAA